MGRNSNWRKLPMKSRAGLSPFLLLGLLSGCAATGDKATDNFSDSMYVADAVPKVEPKSKYGNPESYVVFGKRYYTKDSSKGYVERGLASWYGKKFHGRRTSSGEPYNMYAMTAAHKTLPLPSYARVTNMANGRSTVVRINDRGPFHGSRIIDLSYLAACKLGVVAKGTAMVEVRAIDPQPRQPKTNLQNSFLASGDGPFEAHTPPEQKAIVAQESRKTYKLVSPAETAETGAAKGEDTQAPTGSEPTVAATHRLKSKKAAGSSMYLQVGAFGSRLNAEQLRSQLVSQIAEQVRVRTSNDAGTPWYKVQVGPLQSRKSANDLSQRLASLGLKKPHVVVE
jgi:rare lipoprotein A